MSATAEPGSAVRAQPAHRWTPGLETVWLALPLLLIFGVVNLSQVPPNDFWWHTRIGQIVVTTGAIPAADLFSFTRQGQPWFNQSWLMETLFYLLYRAGGLPLIILTHAVTVTAGYVLVQRACLAAAADSTGAFSTLPRLRPGAVRAAAAGALLAALLGLTDWTVRPQSASFALFGAVVLIVERDRRAATRLLWALPPLFALWANLHGGFVFGLGLLGIYAACRAGEALSARTKASATPTHEQATGTPEASATAYREKAAQARRTLLAAALSGLAATANPAGLLGTVRYVLGFVQNSATQTLNMEFQPLSARNADGALFIGFAVLFLLLLYVRRVRPDGYVVASLLIFGVASLYSRRVTPWFAMAAGPAIAWALTARRPGAETTQTKEQRPANRTESRPRGNARGADAKARGAANWVLMGCLGTFMVATLPWLRGSLLPLERQAYTRPHSTPVAAAEKLCELPGRAATFAEIGFASYLEWACPPAAVMIDTRFELYPAELWRDYVHVSAAKPGWQDMLDRNGAAVILASKEEQPELVAAVKASSAWRVAYEDEDSLLAEREVTP